MVGNERLEVLWEWFVFANASTVTIYFKALPFVELLGKTLKVSSIWNNNMELF